MPVISQKITLSNTTPTLIVGNHTMIQEVHLHNMTKSSNEYVHLGPANMTLANSIHIDPGESIEMNVIEGDELYAMSDPNGLTVGVLINRKND
jgi:acyl-[acyl carrier protein]--UDP-N-acetylglucosamine O-acyltransferase